MAVETIIPPAAPPQEKLQRAPRRFRVRRFSWPTWLARVLVESFFIMLSILLALAVDNWSESQRHQRLALQSLQVFEREIRQNLAAIEDNIPYHSGLRSVVAQAVADPSQAADMRTIVEGLKPVLLYNTAWETAVASAALTHVDVEIISRLSRMYSVQERFRLLSLSATQRFPVGIENDPSAVTRNVRDIYSYLNELVAGEEELVGNYRQAIQMINAELGAQSQPDSAATSP